ncbi:acetate kinase [Actinotalea sp.]|uniref:acetate/propionate family kinase n=1 Tax=Actinotalea sp. TaxID=1872145 RepID=UPI002BDC0647|nr:acetate kinase [Actinotalea sp.]HQY33763.1 acetate kinase [Actinotalea sp.]HRA51822.1 acetate kinase [Actinotalea sp.]
MSAHVLVINSGSSSIKYQLVDVESGDAMATGLIERIGQPTGSIRHEGPDGTTKLEQPVPDHEAGIAVILDLFATHGPRLAADELAAIGHRVVQGGSRFPGPALVDDAVEAAISELATLAPLHNPPNLSGIRAARHAFPTVPHVAVFDTSFHTTLPPAAYTYAIDRQVAADYAIRRYGAHGTSHLYVSRHTAELLGKDPSEVNVIVLHLGNGASATAVRGGVSVETSMGLTPLEGLVMGTRSGDIDPAVLFHLQRVAGMTTDELDDLLNRRSGMLGLSGSSDMRDVHDAVAAGDENARTALEVYYHRIKSYVGSYYAHLGHVDAIAFTAGIGENDDIVRINSLAGLERLGIAVDPERNAGRKKADTVISPDGSEVTVLVVPTNEELEIARQAVALVTA